MSWFKSRGVPAQEPPVDPDPPGMWAWINEPLSQPARNIIARVARSAAKDHLAELLELAEDNKVREMIKSMVQAAIIEHMYGDPPYSRFHAQMKEDKQRQWNCSHTRIVENRCLDCSTLIRPGEIDK